MNKKLYTRTLFAKIRWRLLVHEIVNSTCTRLHVCASVILQLIKNLFSHFQTSASDSEPQVSPNWSTLRKDRKLSVSDHFHFGELNGAISSAHGQFCSMS